MQDSTASPDIPHACPLTMHSVLPTKHDMPLPMLSPVSERFEISRCWKVGGPQLPEARIILQ